MEKIIKLKTKKEIILETVEYYKTHTRAVNNEGVCYYLNYAGNMCAVGRLLINPSLFSDKITDADCLLDEFGFDILKPEYRIEDTTFWNKLQNFHDINDHWEENNLTEEGERILKQLLTTYEVNT